MEILQIGFIGFGLIGGSIAKALRAYRPQCRMIATSRSLSPLYQAQKDGVLDEVTDCVNEQFSGCDIIFICTPVVTITKYFELLKPLIKPSCILTDVGSVKESIYTAAKNAGLENNFIGGHPMAGTHNSGFKYARANLYHGAPMVLVPPVFDDIDLLQRAKDLLAPAEFGKFSVTTAEEHDRMIAFTSQLAHVVSNAYIKSPTAGSHKGFSAGSYKDMTRVAWLNPQMWAELFLENRDYLMQELSVLSENLAAYQKALETQDLAGLTKLLDDGKRRKEEVDGR